MGPDDEERTSLFREQAVRHHFTGRAQGEVLRLAPGTRRRRVPYVEQMEAADCGAACLAMVLGYYGRRVTLDEAREATGTSHGGVAADELLRAAARFGLRGRGVRLEPEELGYLPPGSILHWGFDHFVVLERVTRRGVRIVDPARGRRLVSLALVGQQFTGVALALEPGEGFERGGATDRVLLRYLARVLRHRGVLARIVVLSLLVQLLALSVPLLIGVLVDRVVPLGEARLLGVVAAGIAVIVLFQVLALLVRSYQMIHVRSLLDRQLSTGFMEHLSAVPLRFFLARSPGDLTARYESNRSLRQTLTSASLSTLLDGALVSVYLVLLLVANVWIGALVAVLGALQVALLFAFGGRYRERMSEELEAQGRTQGHVVEMLAGIETLKALGVEPRWLERWQNLFVDELNAAIRRSRLGALAGALTNGLALASPLAVLVIGAWQVLEGRLTLGTMLALNALAAGFLTPLQSLVTTAMSLQEVRSHVARIEDVLRAPPEQERTLARAPRLAGGIRVDGVSFRYAGDAPWVLRDVSLEILPGQKVAIVGRSGAGKSTLARILVGLYAPVAGRVLFDGVDLAEVETRSVREQIGVVTQGAHVFGATVRDNIALADPALGLDAVVEAAQLAEIHGEIEALSMGYDTPLAAGGASLSGGQRQRLALARALVRRPAILLLDEATSDLDAINESRVMQRLAELRSTRIVIAHRLSTIADADAIFVLDGGRLVESGRHEALVARGGAYAALVAAQTSAGGSHS